MKNHIREVRRSRDMTQAELAAQTGVGVPQVSRWESGTVNIPSQRLMQIADVLRVNPGDLLPDGQFALMQQLEQGIDPAANHRDNIGRNVKGLPSGQRFAVTVGGGDPAMAPNAKPFRMEGASQERMREDLPVYGSALGASRPVDGEAIEQTTLNRAEVMQYVRRPVILNGNSAAYGLYVSGSSMEPRHMDGDMLLVDPKGRVRGGEDVVVYLRPTNPEDDDGEAARAVLVKRLIRRTAEYIELKQFHPETQFRIDARDVVRIDRVIPWQELIS